MSPKQTSTYSRQAPTFLQIEYLVAVFRPDSGPWVAAPSRSRVFKYIVAVYGTIFFYHNSVKKFPQKYNVERNRVMLIIGTPCITVLLLKLLYHTRADRRSTPQRNQQVNIGLAQGRKRTEMLTNDQTIIWGRSLPKRWRHTRSTYPLVLRVYPRSVCPTVAFPSVWGL